MNETIERVARAIASSRHLSEELWPDWVPEARAAIETIEPTEEMEQAFVAQGYKRMNFKLQFKAAINAALGKVDA